MDTEAAYAATDELGRTIEYHEPTMTFEPLEYSSTSLKPPGLITPLVDRSNTNTLLSNIRHQRQQSVPNVYYSNADSLSPSPSPKPGHVRRQSQGMPLTGDGRAGRRPDNSPARYGTWLSATPSSSSADEAVSPNTTPKSRRSIASVSSDTTPKSATQSRFGFFASLTTRLSSPAAAQTPQEIDDEIINMDIEAALYPSATDRDTFSPAAYKNLQTNAAGLLRKMQDAYRQRAATIREMRAEHEAHAEEMAETELRIRSFKSQLESMAAKAAEQEKAMQQLVAELQAERGARREAEDRASSRGRAGAKARAGLVESPLITEDLCADVDVDDDAADDEEEKRKRCWRNSDGTVRSDLSIDTSAGGTSVTDGESVEAESIFSRSRSPTATVTTTMTETEVPPTPQQHELLAIRSPHNNNNNNNNTPGLSPKPGRQLTTFQKLVKGISGGGGGGGGTGDVVDGCGNCRGQDASVAWDTVSLLRDENKSLKHRVAQLEVVVEGALDVVNGIGV
ncbi:hypothetical protein F5Y00DRAFT_111778 [Daldinia vernicosa]|uniref:uncharacterized protein n=1 Tax=Daldinia vernicosa TaxID=114800 RepID=UPI002008386A|nr:uncharacterized protein F5Y00DRAFT_111778 [Daldinia vernicosa]KAI0847826.1 hypothetical protein F5Y00DRAFT_111778 [Daldinia vernicosa]